MDANAPLSLVGTTLSIDLSGYQPIDADLTSLAAASSTNAFYYRSAANTWSPATIGAGLTFSGGTLIAPGVAISDTPPGSPVNGDLWWESDTGTLYMSYNDGNTVQWVAVGGGGVGRGGLVGVTDGSAAVAGTVGEYQQFMTVAGPTLAVSTITNCGSLALTAGDWDVWLNANAIPPSTGGLELELSASATLSAAFPNYQIFALMSASSYNSANMGPFRFNSASPITVTLMARAGVANIQLVRILIAARRRR